MLAGTGDQAVIIEDVVASGGSAARAIRALLAETSLQVAGVQSIANWNFPEMRDLLAPWTVRAVTSYPQVLDSAREAGLLSAADVASSCASTPTRAGTAGILAPGLTLPHPEPSECNTCFNSSDAKIQGNTYYKSQVRAFFHNNILRKAQES